jgi:hypothetical protein
MSDFSFGVPVFEQHERSPEQGLGAVLTTNGASPPMAGPIAKPRTSRVAALAAEGDFDEFGNGIIYYGNPIVRPMLRFKAFEAAQPTLAGTEFMPMLWKHQWEAGADQGLTPAQSFYALAA